MHLRLFLFLSFILLATAPGWSQSALGTPTPVSSPFYPFGVRVSSELAFFNLSDLNSNQASLQYNLQQLQNSTPSYNYKAQTTTLNSAVVFEINPFVAINPNIDAGVAFDYWAFTPLNFDQTDIHPVYFHDYEHTLNAIEINAKLRFYLFNVAKSGVRVFLEPSAGFQPINYELSEPYQHTTNNPSDNQVGDNVNATAFDAGLQAGIVLPFTSWFSYSFSGGFEYAYATNFTGTWSDAGVPAKNGVSGTNRFYNVPNSGPGYIAFTPSDPNNYALFGLTQALVNDSRPMVVDLSGIHLSMAMNFLF